MRTRMTIRIDGRLREALERKARASGRTLSQVVRETLAEALDVRSLAEQIGQLRGALDIEEPVDPWRARLRGRNWRP